jgi:ligand-binding sensor domain-containing protein
MKVDRYDNIWLLNSYAANQKVIAVYTPQLDWYFFAVPEGILSDVVRSLDFDGIDRVWVGTQSGVSVIDYNNTLADKSDDRIEGNNLTTADGLESNDIKDVAIDQDDIVWIATASGVNYWDPKTPEKVYIQYGLLSNSINKIEVDIRNNKWFGTTAGVSILAADGYSWTHYSTENSPLVNDNVTSFGFDLETGKAYIGTTNGLSVLETPYSRPRENLSQVKAGPNPFIISQGQQFAISELSDDVAIKFMTENGMIVRHISKDEISGAFTTWDGRNGNGEYVASGIYVYVIYNEETGLNRVGKVAVIR